MDKQSKNRLPEQCLSQAVEAVKAASPEECVFSVADCMIPSLTEKIGDALHESGGDRYGLVNELAHQLRHIKEGNGVLTYKAMRIFRWRMRLILLF